MKIKYTFVTGESVEIEVSEEWGEIAIYLDRLDYNVNQKETRRHTSLDGMDYEGNFFADSTDVESDLIQSEEYQELHTALSNLNPTQQAMVTAIFFQGMSISEYAAQEGVDHSAISHRLKTVYKKLKKYF